MTEDSDGAFSANIFHQNEIEEAYEDYHQAAADKPESIPSETAKKYRRHGDMKDTQSKDQAGVNLVQSLHVSDSHQKL